LPRRIPLRSRVLATALGIGLLFLVLRFLPGPPPPAVDPVHPTVRVRLAGWSGRERVPLRIRGRYRILGLEGEEVLWEGAEYRGAIRGGAAGPRLTGLDPLRPAFRIAPEGDAALRLDADWYRGELVVDGRGRRGGELAPRLELYLDLPLEDYVLGVVCGEMAAGAAGAAAALRAQAIAARSWALWELRRGRPFLNDDARDQRFLGVDFETLQAREAVAATEGRVLVWDGELLHAYFHADCGGGTADAWSLEFSREELPPLAGVSDPGCAEDWPWEKEIPAAELDRLARDFELGAWLRRVRASQRDRFGRVLRVLLAGEFATRSLGGEALRRILDLPSTLWLDLEALADGGLRVTGRGRGHGVGLCQEGALRRSRAGASAGEILAHYYPGAEIVLLGEHPGLLRP